MAGEVYIIMLLAFIGSVVALIGGVVFLYIKPWTEFLIKYSTPFAAGVLLTVSLVGLLPEAYHLLGETAFLVVLFSFLAAYLFESLICDLHHHNDSRHNYKKDLSSSSWIVVVGDTIHNFIDGVAIAAAYLINPGLGIITTASTFLHEVPHEIGDFGILLKTGWKKKKVLLVNLISALFTLVGAFMVIIINPSAAVIGILLAIAAGMFLYLGASDFLPHAGDSLSTKKAVTSLLLGVIIMLFTLNLIPHSHQDDHSNDHNHNHLEDDHKH